ncbi:2-oxoglutarate dehydrogenase E1 component [Segetibacter aerophilus]|uniref:oxoglutarate dehydrogenase (succinyl-transferring) n=1 Tax=Segetibacter aerophilus TaxID=670293 RepID=A0A512B8S2_9BACT|nr:2-oxoglutarate dehydrogenase E1 component [Segetibacter aerophilus]GEO08356.1 2-oxoglutarate dehydrogenase subunit E1 [Segetibacter aerophilus]
MKDFSYITNSHPAYIENLYNDFVNNPESVDPEMRKFFEGFDFAVSKVTPATNGQANGQALNGKPVDTQSLQKEFSVFQLIRAYRKKGHLVAKTNPIRERKDRRANLQLSNFGLSDADLNTTFEAGKFIGKPNAALKDIIDHLQKSYTASVGVEYSGMNDQERIEWLGNEIENEFHKPFSTEDKKCILEKLNQGVMFEKFLHTKYVGQKRFSLEGGETTIAALDAIINTSAELGVQEVVIGMAHRGRLNVLANILGKTYEQIFSEFEGTSTPDTTMGSGDVKYHMGYRGEHTTKEGKKVNLQLCPNPSHLEAVDPVVVGFARSKADVIYESDYDKILPILIHGDASVAGQGIVYEVVQMSGLKGYYTGGTIHFVINNQIGFTTDFDDARTADYSTSIAAMIQAPVLHVNGDDPEAVVKCVNIATRFRQKFNTDVFIDMVCYRRHGHNEGDDPKYTQPKLYALIEKHANPREVYNQKLIENGSIDAELAKEMEKKFWSDLQERLDDIKQNPLPYKYQKPELWWQDLRKATKEDFDKSPVTAITEEQFKTVFDSLMKWPEGFQPLRKVEKLVQDKVKLFENENMVDWATGELLAYGSLLLDGNDVRMSGQDVRRGTFSHRHAVLRDENTDESYNRLSRIPGAEGKFRIYNSFLSEFGVLGFEYGYSIANPNTLVLWEGQFGDFFNTAQPMVDQFISSGETKWRQMSGLVMLLPHGYEGQGPEHSSGRMERFLQMSAELNWIVADITTAANFFHALRRQLAWPFRKPLIVFTPKANLRHPGSYSKMGELTNGSFKEVIDDSFVENAEEVKKVLFCSGKIYFDLAERQQKENHRDVAIVRLEQIYPLPMKQLEQLYKKYNKATWFWVQEEPMNMGAASFLQMNLKGINYGVISRQPSASTATGYAKVHAQEQKEIVDTAFSI